MAAQAAWTPFRRELPSFAEILRDHAALEECDLDELQRELDHRAESMLH